MSVVKYYRNKKNSGSVLNIGKMFTVLLLLLFLAFNLCACHDDSEDIVTLGEGMYDNNVFDNK